jgi:N-acetyl-anhydromuramyl-L-alanine amidase AmpD
MDTRRDFIRRLTLAGASIALCAGAQAKEGAKASVRFTQDVREKSKRLHIARGRWRWLVIHHSGTKYGDAAIYDRQHRERGMENGLAYHFVIGNGIDSGDGEVEIGSRWLKQLKGGHVHREDINKVGIGICLVGNLEETKPTRNQMLALRELIDYLRSDVVGKNIRFAVHREIDPRHTACPGRHFPAASLHHLYGKFVPAGVIKHG